MKHPFRTEIPAPILPRLHRRMKADTESQKDVKDSINTGINGIPKKKDAFSAVPDSKEPSNSVHTVVTYKKIVSALPVYKIK